MGDLREKVCQKYNLEIRDIELSMGMSGDYIEAVVIRYRLV